MKEETTVSRSTLQKGMMVRTIAGSSTDSLREQLSSSEFELIRHRQQLGRVRIGKVVARLTSYPLYWIVEGAADRGRNVRSVYHEDEIVVLR